MCGLSIYFDFLIFIFLLYYLMKGGYYRGFSWQLKFEVKNHIGSGIIILVLAVLSIFLFDLPLSTFFSQPNLLDFLSTFIKLTNNFGNGNLVYPVLVLLVFISYFLNWGYQRVLSTVLSSSVFAGTINIFLKFLVSRERPYVHLNPYNFFDYIDATKNNSLFHTDYMSMPSGHTILAFAAMVPLFLICKNRILKSVFISLPVLVGFGRIFLFRHWLSDVLIAAFLGTMIGIASYRINIAQD